MRTTKYRCARNVEVMHVGSVEVLEVAILGVLLQIGHSTLHPPGHILGIGDIDELRMQRVQVPDV